MILPFSIKNPGWLGSLVRTPTGDLAGGARGSWSVARKTFADYSGPAYRGRNSTTSVEADIGYNADGTVNFDEVYALGGNGTQAVVATRFYDNSPNGLDMIMATAAMQPLVYDPFVDATALYGVNAPAHGIPCAGFFGAESIVTALDATWTGRDSAFAVFAHTGWTAGDMIITNRGTVEFKVIQQSSPGASPDLRMFETAALGTNTFPLNEIALASCIFNGASSSFRRNDSSPITGSTGTARNAFGWGVGSNWSSGFNFAFEDFVELTVWNSALPTDDELEIVANLMNNFGL